MVSEVWIIRGPEEVLLRDSLLSALKIEILVPAKGFGGLETILETW